MKSVLFLILIFLAFGCNTKKEDTNLEKNIHVSLKNTEDYYYDLKIGGDEEGASFKVQAMHYQVSELVRDVSTGYNVIYHYLPEAGYQGTDYVEIETCTGGDGTGCTDSNVIRINFDVTK